MDSLLIQKLNKASIHKIMVKTQLTSALHAWLVQSFLSLGYLQYVTVK